MSTDVNKRAMDRYRSSILIEASSGAVHVTIGGKHYINDWAKVDEAMKELARIIDETRTS